MTLDYDLEFKPPESYDNWLSFIEDWAKEYKDPFECVYEKYINQGLDEESVEALYAWKRGGMLFNKQSMKKNYIEPLADYKKSPPNHKDLECTYLEYKPKGGIIWGIFYLHILSKNKPFNQNLTYEYPIFDQHVYRAMQFMQSNKIEELPDANKNKQNMIFVYCEYKKYMCFYQYIENTIREELNKNGDLYKRKIDKALFAFGKHLKEDSHFAKTPI